MSHWGKIIGGVIGTCVCPGWGSVIGVAIGSAVDDALGNKNNGDMPILNIRVNRKYISVENESIEVFEVQIKGDILAPSDKTSADFLLGVIDCSGGKEFADGDAIVTSDDSLSSFGKGILSPKMDFVLPYQRTEWPDWTTIFTIPVSILIFPYKGIRNLKFSVFVTEKNNFGNVFSSAEENISYNVTEIGYLEYETYQRYADKVALEIARLIVFVNSTCYSFETNAVVNEWINSRVVIQDEDDKQRKNELHSLALEVKKRCDIVNPLIVRQKAIELSKSCIKTNEKYSFMEFFIKIAASLENFGEMEMKLLDIIADALGLDEKEYQSAKHKYIHTDKMGEINPFVTLGISNDLTTDEKKKILRNQYAKWNRLKTHKDTKVRQKAEKMHELIAECEKEISKESV